jgi:DNA polymerase III epsilon subunit-like protein
MNVFIDAEFEEKSNTLISLAIVTEDGEKEFYEVLDYSQVTDEWVLANVIPILQKKPISHEEFQERLAKFTQQFAGMHVICNHPNDVFFYCLALRQVMGKWIMVQPLTFEIDDDLSGKGSELLHNALADTRATRESWLKKHGLV